MARTYVEIEDLPQRAAELDDDTLGMIMGGAFDTSGYICTASKDGDCRKE